MDVSRLDRPERHGVRAKRQKYLDHGIRAKRLRPLAWVCASPVSILREGGYREERAANFKKKGGDADTIRRNAFNGEGENRQETRRTKKLKLTQ